MIFHMITTFTVADAATSRVSKLQISRYIERERGATAYEQQIVKNEQRPKKKKMKKNISMYKNHDDDE